MNAILAVASLLLLAVVLVVAFRSAGDEEAVTLVVEAVHVPPDSKPATVTVNAGEEAFVSFEVPD